MSHRNADYYYGAPKQHALPARAMRLRSARHRTTSRAPGPASGERLARWRRGRCSSPGRGSCPGHRRTRAAESDGTALRRPSWCDLISNVSLFGRVHLSNARRPGGRRGCCRAGSYRSRAVGRDHKPIQHYNGEVLHGRCERVLAECHFPAADYCGPPVTVKEGPLCTNSG
jgi:hypothetical protein